MKSLDLRQELANKYGKDFDKPRNWCSELINVQDLTNEQIIPLLYYLRSFTCDLQNIIHMGKRSKQDAILLSIAGEFLQGEVLVNVAGKHHITNAPNYIDEVGRNYTPRQIMLKCLYLVTEDSKDEQRLFNTQSKKKEIIQQYILNNLISTVVLMVEPGYPNYYVISSKLLHAEGTQEKRIKLVV